MDEQRIKTLFPRASRSFLDANAELRAVESKQSSRTTLVDAASGKEKSDERIVLSYVLYRVWLLDPDNAVGATKTITDCLCEVGLIPDDSETEIDLTVTQEKVRHRYEQKTVVNITYP